MFTAEQGSRIDQSNLASRVLKPAAVRAGLGTWVIGPRGGKRAESWVSFHSMRHTCASCLFRAGWNAKQVQVWLGHHSPAFTLAKYVHLIPDDLPEAVSVAAVDRAVDNAVTQSVAQLAPVEANVPA